MKRLLAVSFIVAISFTIGAMAQTSDQQGNGATPPAAQTPSAQQPPATTEPHKETKEEKKKRKEKEKQEKAAKDQDVVDTGVFTQREANDVLGQIRDGLEGHTQRLMLGAFDGDHMDGYLSFEDQLEAFFNKYESITVHINITSSSIEGSKGIVNATFQMELTTRTGQSTRRNGELRFELEHTKKGWKVVDVNPRNFFS